MGTEEGMAPACAEPSTTGCSVKAAPQAKHAAPFADQQLVLPRAFEAAFSIELRSVSPTHHGSTVAGVVSPGRVPGPIRPSRVCVA